MEIGILTFNGDNSQDPRLGLDPVELAIGAEERGFAAIHIGEHCHIPVSSKLTAHPSQGVIPEQYFRFRDPFVTLTAIAMRTTRLRLWTSACLITEHHPLMLAKTVATLDHMSGGRFTFGVTQGWNRDEMQNMGVDPKKALRVMRERILAMKEVWTHEEAEFHGEFVDFDPVISWPKPFQQPHPPIYVAGKGPSALGRVVEYGDGWFPTPERDETILESKMAELQDMASAAGRGPIPVVVMNAPVEKLDYYAKIGVAGVGIMVPIGPTEAALKAMDDLTVSAAAFL